MELTKINDETNLLDSGRKLLYAEANGVLALAESLDGSFEQAVTTLVSITGRVIVSGMGKSGHIARKIAATMASTGTPAYFVHPSEASHGDLGMITQADAVIALSNSGNTAELSDLLTYTRRFKIPLIAITAAKQSAVAEASDVALVLPAMPEGCPLGLAPTTSTTMALALGDALAVTLIAARGFDAQDFSLFHPGGSLGGRFLRVADIMHSGESIPVCQEGTSMSEAILCVTRKAFGCIGVLDNEGRLQGIVTDGDLRRHMTGGLLNKTAGEVMTRNPLSLRRTALAAEAINIMNRGAVAVLFVTSPDQKPEGILHIHDCLRAGLS